MSEYLRLGYGQVGLAALLILINGGISLGLRLGLERRLLVASVRTTVQLLLVGLVLQQVFALKSPTVVVIWMLFMAVVAGVAAVRRSDRRYPGIWWDSVLSIWLASWIVTGIALTGIVGVDPWWKAQYSIPLLGMILGNALNGISLGLDRLGEELTTRRGEVELRLTLGATRWQAALPALRNAVRTGMIPILNSMNVVGLVSLPGMMTGQLLAGVDPVEAVKYQIVIMFLIAAGTALGTVGVVLLGYRRLFNHRHQFLASRLTRA
ncbi:MAG: iron export ABC transporter permease subunit FetB [Thermoanaerobaculia bacterium]|nr:iron export ABC transporter permease subunit FetB [Thermoanaerobaculia bacterium]